MFFVTKLPITSAMYSCAKTVLMAKRIKEKKVVVPKRIQIMLPTKIHENRALRSSVVKGRICLNSAQRRWINKRPILPFAVARNSCLVAPEDTVLEGCVFGTPPDLYSSRLVLRGFVIVKWVSGIEELGLSVDEFKSGFVFWKWARDED